MLHDDEVINVPLSRHTSGEAILVVGWIGIHNMGSESFMSKSLAKTSQTEMPQTGDCSHWNKDCARGIEPRDKSPAVSGHNEQYSKVK